MSSAHRFLGFGFAAADLLLEIGADGRVSFALGAGEAVLGAPDQALAGRAWQSLFDPDDHAMVEALFGGLDGGTRAGPVVLRVSGKSDGHVSLTAIRLAQNDGAISCALSRASSRGAHGLQSRETFESRAAELLAGASQDLELAFVELTGLSASAPARDPARLEALLAGVLRAQAYRGEGATAVGPDRYALVRGRDEPTEAMMRRIARVLTNAGLDNVAATAASIPLTGV